MDEYETLLKASGVVKFGTRNVKLDTQLIPEAWALFNGKQRLFLKEIKEFHREYEWAA